MKTLQKVLNNFNNPKFVKITDNLKTHFYFDSDNSDGKHKLVISAHVIDIYTQVATGYPTQEWVNVGSFYRTKQNCQDINEFAEKIGFKNTLLNNYIQIRHITTDAVL